ncbi:MAG: PQQ-dependent oxidoreductase, gdhB family, partial [uncultured Gemmatimonadaceae bacterium]
AETLHPPHANPARRRRRARAPRTGARHGDAPPDADACAAPDAAARRGHRARRQRGARDARRQRTHPALCVRRADPGARRALRRRLRRDRRRQGAGEAVGGGAAPGRRPARHREAGAAARRLGRREDRRADHGAPGGRRPRPGRAARRRAEPELRHRPHDLLELFGAAAGRQRDERRARRALGRPCAAGAGARDPPCAPHLRGDSPLRLAPRVRPRRDALRHARRPLRHADAAARAAAGQPHGEDPAHPPRRLCTGRQPVRAAERRPPRDLDARAPERAGGGVRCRGAALGGGARHARWRRAQPRREGEELRLAGGRLRCGVLRRGHRRVDHRARRHAAAGVLLGPGDRTVRCAVLHRLRLPRVARQPVHRRDEGQEPRAAHHRQRARHGRGAAARRPRPARARRAPGPGRRALRRHRPGRRRAVEDRSPAL